MDRIENRYVIYKDFENDAAQLFSHLIDAFKFEIVDLSIYGIHLSNNRCDLDITYDSSLQLWLKVRKYDVSEMIPILSMFKGEHIFNKYQGIASRSCSKDQFHELVDFLMENFKEELSPIT